MSINRRVLGMALRLGKQVRLVYRRKQDGPGAKPVVRHVSPYELGRRMFWGGCKKHGTKTHSFIRENIQSMSVSRYYDKGVYPKKFRTK